MHHIKASIQKPNGKQKPGKGFSVNELKAAGVSRQQAKQAKLPVDLRRKSQHDVNVEAIKAHAKKA
ncbi:MAG: ribosomal protein L13e [Candidatus Bathyarchaeota archaeon]|nr:ribosomal protein L13e [Candidatus Bathyarchaeota archaeon]